MNFWRFVDEQTLSGLSVLVPSYNHQLGWLAGLLAVFSGFALFPTLARVRSSRTTMSRRAWLIGGAFTISVGFWGTQNMALLGFVLPAAYKYDPVTGFAAILPAVAGCAGTIRVLTRATSSAGRMHLGALSLALGIAAMHYTLMEAITGDVILVYDPGLFLLSLALGYGFALIALYVNRALSHSARDGRFRWLAGGLVLGITVLANHFSAMAAATFFDNPAILSAGVAVLPALMIPLIGGCVLFLVTAFWIGSVVDGRLGEASESIRSSEARNRAVIDTMLDAHLITDRQGIIRSFNPAAEEAFGWKADEVIGQPVTTLIHESRAARPEDWPKRSEKAAAMPVTRRRWVYPHGGTRKDGSRFPIEVAISPFQVDGDQYFSCAVRDLTATWAAEARLRRLAAAIEQAGDAIAIMDADQRIQYVNPQYEKQTGSTQDEVLGRRPASGASDDGVYADMWATVGQGRTWTGQVRSRRRDGAVRDEELTVTPVFDGTASISGYVAVMRDITKRLEADLERRQLAEALQHCTDSIEILDSQGRIVYVNAAFEASNGQRLADIRGSRPEALTDFGPAADRYEDMMRTAYRGGRPWSGTLKSLSADGGTREEDVTVSPLRDDRGQVSGYVVVKRDTTDRRRLESQIRQRQKLESIGQLADGIAHELNAPIQLVDDNLRFLRESFGELDRLLAEFAGLGKRSNAVPPSAIAGCLQKADVEFLQREIGRALDQSGDGLHRMAGIVRAMRDMSYSSPEKAPVDLNRAIQNTITVSTNEWQHVAEIRTSFDPALPPVVCMPGDVSLVLLGLLVNAAHAISETNRSGIRGKGVITVSTHRLNEFAEIRIGDTGRGVPPEARRRLFDPQAAPGTAGHDLSMAHEVIVNQHGGTIALDSEPGKGATFIIRLPIAAAASVGAIAAA